MEMKTVTARGVALGEGLPKICIPVTAHNMTELEAQLGVIAGSACDMVEWRADFYEDIRDTRKLKDALETLREKFGDKPLLFTFRTKEEGGEQDITPEAYEALNLAAADTGLVDFIDLERNRGEALFRRIAGKVHEAGVWVIGSFHDFAKTPPSEEITGILCGMQTLGADVTKAAVMPQNEYDVMTLLEASLSMKKQYADRPYITMSMGRLGGISRLCGSLTGSALTFATAGKASAPGQMEADAVAGILPALES